MDDEFILYCSIISINNKANFDNRKNSICLSDEELYSSMGVLSQFNNKTLKFRYKFIYFSLMFQLKLFDTMKIKIYLKFDQKLCCQFYVDLTVVVPLCE